MPYREVIQITPSVENIRYPSEHVVLEKVLFPLDYKFASIGNPMSNTV